MHLSYKSLFQDVRRAVDYVHMKGSLKAKTCEDLAKYIKKDDRLPQVLYNIQKSGAKTFLLTNSEWEYTDKVMNFLLDFPDAPHAGNISFFKNWHLTNMFFRKILAVLF